MLILAVKLSVPLDQFESFCRLFKLFVRDKTEDLQFAVNTFGL